MPPEPQRVSEGSPAPLGAHADSGGVNFALFSANAEEVELCLFHPGASTEYARVRLPGRTGDVWHAHLAGAQVGALYGYRVHGPYSPGHGHRFNPAKLCLDPYARALSGHVRWTRASHGYSHQDPFNEHTLNQEDSAPCTPRCMVVADRDAQAAGAARPATSWGRTIIYEAHVGGMTRQHPQVEPAARGRFAGLANPAVIGHLHRLGVTAIELMPVHAFVDDEFLVQRGLRNYWGYSTLGFFAPAQRYLGGQGPDAFRQMVDALHEAGIEVILDVVYNHTAEGNAFGPTLSFRGIDNASYYRLDPQRPGHYLDFTGCGNTLDMEHPRVAQLVLDSLRYWASDLGVDGFRFDLAVTLARGRDGFEPEGRFFRAVAADPVLSRCKLIGEPWDLGPDGYRLGGFAPGWGEWNDRYRDTVRRFWRGDSGVLPELAQRIHGSSDLFEHPGRGPWASINFAASHDGFTAMDLVSYEQRHNEANGEDNRDGHAENLSCNHGEEGESRDPRIRALRVRHVANLLATVFLSQGTPMLLAGDEMGRSQGGNNNAYCQDNPTSWLDWSGLATHRELVDLVAALGRLRAEHPVLCREQFVHGDARGERTGIPDIQWLHPRGTPMGEADWHEPGAGCLGVLLGTPDPARSPPEDIMLALFNAGRRDVRFSLPEVDGLHRHFHGWQRALHTGDPPPVVDEHAVVVRQRSVCVLVPGASS